MNVKRILGIFLILAGVMILPACSYLASTKDDNPRIRKLQRASLKGISPRPISGESIPDYFGPRVGLVLSEHGSGRAAALTPDGYYLTADHVVDGEKFYLYRVTRLRPIEDGKVISNKDYNKYFRDERFYGRVVWRNPEADLAIVKFPFRPKAWFKNWSDDHEKETIVFAGATDGFLRGDSMKRLKGNGRFETSGRILAVADVDSEPVHKRVTCDLIARGGMSGAPVADSKGSLLGIAVVAWKGLAYGRLIGTEFSMVEPKILRKAIARDRRKKGR